MTTLEHILRLICQANIKKAEAWFSSDNTTSGYDMLRIIIVLTAYLSRILHLRIIPRNGFYWKLSLTKRPIWAPRYRSQSERVLYLGAEKQWNGPVWVSVNPRETRKSNDFSSNEEMSKVCTVSVLAIKSDSIVSKIMMGRTVQYGILREHIVLDQQRRV